MFLRKRINKQEAEKVFLILIHSYGCETLYIGLFEDLIFSYGMAQLKEVESSSHHQRFYEDKAMEKSQKLETIGTQKRKERTSSYALPCDRKDNDTRIAGSQHQDFRVLRDFSITLLTP